MRYVSSFFLGLLIGGVCQAQSAVQRTEKVHSTNAYVWYPKGYDTAKTKKWPLILYVPSNAESGTDAKKLLNNGPSKFISEGKLYPDAIVITIQPVSAWPSESWLDGVITSSLKGFKVDTGGLHLIGLQSGGYLIEKYCLNPLYGRKIASCVPISAPEVSEAYGNIPKSINFKTNWLGFVGIDDANFYKQYDLFNRIDKAKGYKAELICDNYGDTRVNTILDPAYRLRHREINIYDWMLAGSVTDFPAIDTSDLQYCVGPADKIRKVIVLRKDGQYQELDSTSIYIPKITFP